jgi:TolA-binding protein
MLFNAAEQIFLGENYTDALNSLNSFINKYPDGAKATQAYFYLAECYNKLGKPEKAADYYYKVMEGGIGAFSEIATLNYGKLSYRLERYQEASEAFETLEKIAQLGNNKEEAKRGLIESYFMCRDYRQTLIETEEVLGAKSTGNQQLKGLAEYYKAKSHLALGERDKALPLLEKMAKDPSSENGAEASYLLIADAYDAGNFENVEKLTFAFSDSGTPQAYWLARSFIVLGDSYAERGNMEQAEATFNSIKENYSPENEDDIADLLKIRLNKLSQMKK